MEIKHVQVRIRDTSLCITINILQYTMKYLQYYKEIDTNVRYEHNMVCKDLGSFAFIFV